MFTSILFDCRTVGGVVLNNLMYCTHYGAKGRGVRNPGRLMKCMYEKYVLYIKKTLSKISIKNNLRNFQLQYCCLFSPFFRQSRKQRYNIRGWGSTVYHTLLKEPYNNTLPFT